MRVISLRWSLFNSLIIPYPLAKSGWLLTDPWLQLLTITQVLHNNELSVGCSMSHEAIVKHICSVRCTWLYLIKMFKLFCTCTCLYFLDLDLAKLTVLVLKYFAHVLDQYLISTIKITWCPTKNMSSESLQYTHCDAYIKMHLLPDL